MSCTGSGTIIFTIIKNKIYVLLTKQTYKSYKVGVELYEDFGGGLSNKNIKLNSAKELLEESAGLILVPTKIYDIYYDYYYTEHKFYRIFFLRIDNIDTTMFDKNFKILQEANFDSHYLESSKIKWFLLDSILSSKHVIKKGFYSNTEEYIEINNKYISQRVWKTLMEAQKIYLDHIQKIKYDCNKYKFVKVKRFNKLNIKTIYIN